MMPPPEFMTKGGWGMPSRLTSVSKRLRYSRAIGMRYALTIVELSRSYSRNSGSTLDDTDTSPCGQTSRSTRPTSCSCAGFA
jgi:hypothetical protein